MKIFLIHGMGRSPLSMIFLQYRLAKLGHQPKLFGYSPTFESLDRVTDRLVDVIDREVASRPYALLGHSLGSVIIRNATPHLNDQQPSVCFFLAPPMVACTGAKMFSTFLPYQLVNGEMGQLLAQDDFMEQLPMPDNTKIYAGTVGPRIPWYPIGNAPNDFILSVEEATGVYSDIATTVHATHTFIMNSDEVLDDIVQTLEEIQ